MDFAMSDKVKELRRRLTAFMDEHVYPHEATFHAEVQANRARGNAWIPTRIMEELKERARAAGLWNLFLPDSARGAGLTNLEYAPLAEIMGRSPIARGRPKCSTAARPTPGTWRSSSATGRRRRRSGGSCRCWRAGSAPASP